MGKVLTHIVMSLDGFIADPHDSPGEIFDWYGAGHVAVRSDDPDVTFYQNYVSASKRNYAGYNDPEFDKLVDQQSREIDPAKRKQLAQDADYKLQEGLGRPIIYHLRAATCWQPYVKGVTLMVNSQYNGWRMEDWWLDK